MTVNSIESLTKESWISDFGFPWPVRYVLVDLDGTISKMPPDEWMFDVLKSMIAQKDEISEDSAYERVLKLFQNEPGRRDVRRFDHVVQATGIDLEEFETVCVNWLESNNTLFKDAVQMLQALHKTGFDLHIATNAYSPGARIRLRRCKLGPPTGLETFRNHKEMQDDVSQKFNPPPYYIAFAEKYNIDLNLAVMIGDNPTVAVMIGDNPTDDCKTALEHGVRFVVLVDRTQDKPIVKNSTQSVIVNDLRIVPKLICLNNQFAYKGGLQ